MEHYSDKFGFWKTTWWLIKRFSTSPLDAFDKCAVADALCGLQSVLVFFALLFGPLLIPFTPLFAAWKHIEKRKRTQKGQTNDL